MRFTEHCRHNITTQMTADILDLSSHYSAPVLALYRHYGVTDSRSRDPVQQQQQLNYEQCLSGLISLKNVISLSWRPTVRRHRQASNNIADSSRMRMIVCSLAYLKVCPTSTGIGLWRQVASLGGPTGRTTRTYCHHRPGDSNATLFLGSTVHWQGEREKCEEGEKRLFVRECPQCLHGVCRGWY